MTPSFQVLPEIESQLEHLESYRQLVYGDVLIRPDIQSLLIASIIELKLKLEFEQVVNKLGGFCHE